MFLKKICTSTLFVLAFISPLFTDDSIDHFMLEDDHFMIMDDQANALKGFDVVSFFDGTPVKGNARFQIEYLDVKWNFANQKNLDKFYQSPHKYLPMHEGYCTYALSQGNFREGIIDYWLIYEDGLYFFCDEEGMKHFQSNPSQVKAKAEEQWKLSFNKMLNEFL